MLRFDAYSATTQAAKAQELVQLVADVVPFTTGWELRMGKGFHTFAERIAFKGQDGTEFASVMWGGKQGDRCMIEVKGDHTPKAVEALRARYPHRCTRVDSCADFDAPRAFERLYRACKQVKKAHRIIGGKMGDWDDFPEKGRTLYLGAPTSVTRLRLYEKGKQPGYAHLAKPNLARLEVQIRPAKEAKTTFSALSAVDVWGASRWTRDLAAMVLREHVDPHPAGTIYRQSDLDRRVEWLCRQAGPTLMELLEDCGTWENVGLTLGEAMRVRQRDGDGVSGS